MAKSSQLQWLQQGCIY
ncbi:hypothetical protein Egran_07113 [Elaphomyces granulatus]|uniref:Uncharacterized protein n=1 Tax=Elaphomyces granulatus TaxID=519963 RepID=A0A232LLT1_9EURO|nr:hypothetical protein Egran_07113 [Elaphomyces granulatus]